MVNPRNATSPAARFVAGVVKGVGVLVDGTGVAVAAALGEEGEL